MRERSVYMTETAVGQRGELIAVSLRDNFPEARASGSRHAEGATSRRFPSSVE